MSLLLKLRLSREQETESVFGVHGVVGQEPELFEDVVSEVLCFVEDEDGLYFGVHGELVTSSRMRL